MRGPRAARIGDVKDAAVFCKAEMIGRMLGDLVSPELQLVKSKASERWNFGIGVTRDRPGPSPSYTTALRTSWPCILLAVYHYWDAIMTHFYQGSLQEGIAAAVRDAKPVTCFVRGRSLTPRVA